MLNSSNFFFAELVPVTENQLVPSQSANTQIIQQAKAKALPMPKPQWHAPWKLYRVISGHLGWVRCVAVEPGNEWFATGSADKIIKVCYLIAMLTFTSFTYKFTLFSQSSFMKKCCLFCLNLNKFYFVFFPSDLGPGHRQVKTLSHGACRLSERFNCQSTTSLSV